MMKLIAWFVGIALVLALVQYITGRIILPEMGLTAPGYGPWFAVALLVEVPLLFLATMLNKS